MKKKIDKEFLELLGCDECGSKNIIVYEDWVYCLNCDGWFVR